MKFTYASGQTPLAGYTIKRGIGKGGFGEVYFAVSDGGKEAALKLLCDNSDIELRGVTQCLNLKHPNLLVLYDLRTDGRGEHWVLMEYMAGETLQAVLTRHANGLSRELAGEWFLALARAVSYLHDRGIVHRDLKPGNIFIENGQLKVGDVGLSKAMSGTQRTAQTQSVGTVQYMAPEISTGNYTKTVDIYALGVILYEMLTGQVPFDGESAGEVLMKHLTTPPDLSKVSADYVPLLTRALAKNPAQRYQSVAEMTHDFEQSGSRQRAPARPAAAPVPPAAAGPVAAPSFTPSVRTRVADVCGSMCLAVVYAALGTIVWAALTRTRMVTDMGAIFFQAVSASWAVLLVAPLWPRSGRYGEPRRLIMLLFGAAVGLAAAWADGWPIGLSAPPPSQDAMADTVLTAFVPSNLLAVASYVSFYALAFFAMRWWRLTDPRRAQRFCLGPMVASAFWGVILMCLFGPPHASNGPYAFALVGAVIVCVMVAAIVQLASPWDGPLPAPPRKLRFRYA